jgi:hypothetical protein
MSDETLGEFRYPDFLRRQSTSSGARSPYPLTVEVVRQEVGLCEIFALFGRYALPANNSDFKEILPNYLAITFSLVRFGV